MLSLNNAVIAFSSNEFVNNYLNYIRERTLTFLENESRHYWLSYFINIRKFRKLLKHDPTAILLHIIGGFRW